MEMPQNLSKLIRVHGLGLAVLTAGCYLTGTYVSEEPRRKTTVVRGVYTTDGTVTDKVYAPPVEMALEGRISLGLTGKSIGAGIGLGTGGPSVGIGAGVGSFHGGGDISLSGSTSDEPRVGISCERDNPCCPGYTVLTDPRSWATFQKGERVTLTFVEMEQITYHDQNEDSKYSPREKVLLRTGTC